MSQDDQWVWIRGTLSKIQSDIAVVISKQDAADKIKQDHEQRIRRIEQDVSNNKLILRAVTSLSVMVAGTAVAVAGSILKSALGF